MRNMFPHPNPWLKRPLCRRYAFAQFRSARVVVQGAETCSRWQWAFGMFADSQFELLGAWPEAFVTPQQIATDLKERGVESIGIISTHIAADDLGARACDGDADSFLASNVLEVDGGPSATHASMLTRHRRRTLRSAIAAAESLHVGLVRALRRQAPFASDEVAANFIACWLEQADQGLAEVRPRNVASRPIAVQ